MQLRKIDGEYQVKPVGRGSWGTGAEVYYASDLDDAVATARTAARSGKSSRDQGRTRLEEEWYRANRAWGWEADLAWRNAKKQAKTGKRPPLQLRRKAKRLRKSPPLPLRDRAAARTETIFVLQGNYGYGHGWEDLVAEKTRTEARQRRKEYVENEGGNYRIIQRRVDKTTQEPVARRKAG